MALFIKVSEDVTTEPLKTRVTDDLFWESSRRAHGSSSSSGSGANTTPGGEKFRGKGGEIFPAVTVVTDEL